MIGRSGPGIRSASTGDLIEEYERAHRELVASEKRANAETRWWLLLPIVALLVPIALVGFAVVVALGESRFYAWLALVLPLLALLAWLEVVLVRRLGAPRIPSLRRRRELRGAVRSLKREIWQREPAATTGVPLERLPTGELVGEIESARRGLVAIDERLRHDVRIWRVTRESLIVLPLFVVAVFLIWMPLDTGRYGLLGVGVPLLGVVLWATVLSFRRVRRQEVEVAGRRRMLRRRIRQAQQVLTKSGAYGLVRRQPTVFAQRLWTTFPVGRSPEVMLRRLPEGTRRTRLWFHRHVGWGTVTASVIAIGVLTLAIVARVAGWR